MEFGLISIECTWMRFGGGPTGLNRIATDPKQTKTWTLSAAAITNLSSSLTDMLEAPKDQGHSHKEEAVSRMKSDAADRKTLQDMFTMYMNPLEPEEHVENKLQNIVTG